MTCDQASLVRTVERGGMVVASGDDYHVFRTSDGRRGGVGVLSAEKFAALQADKALVRLPGRSARWVWRDLQTRSSPSVEPPAHLQGKRGGQRRTLLELALAQADGADERYWLARAAIRFLRDYERQSATQSITMNWSFDFAGQGRGGRGYETGMSEMSLSAVRSVAVIRRHLGEKAYRVLERSLIDRVPARVLSQDFGLARPKLGRYLADVLRRVARLYDRHIAPER